jgi:hypothetical protein
MKSILSFLLPSVVMLAFLMPFIAPMAHAQASDGETTAIPNEVLVMLNKGVDSEKVWSSLSESISFEIVGVPSPSTGIFLLNVESLDWPRVAVIFESHPHVRAAQLNHTVKERETVPNDPNFGQQWHHVQSGDHDIDSELAWDVTTGGTAGNGARIVVAVLEGGGSNFNHVDLIDNHWVNLLEIPNNGIDDDENGYVDDYDGWNSGDDNDNINAGGHGTSVSGMIGAVGDNGIGGSGVNWDVDIMQIDMPNGLSEGNVIASYEYPKVMRDFYNETQGSKGAFVVATNASWGIDQANPENYPVWCAYYDELGASGILNCGATTNQNLNVDAVGDMPTACGSNYMVSVTATNDNDVRTFSGYGATTIDLAAPGDQVYLPNGSAGYGNTSGTSFASPCVAGAIALIYSVPCPGLASLALSNPQGAADLVLGYLYEGTDLVPNLEDEVVTGGRLNVANSVELALAGCGPVECEIDSFEGEAFCVFDPLSDSVMTSMELTATFTNFLCEAETLCYKDSADDSWTCNLTETIGVEMSSENTVNLTGLNPNTVYEVYFTLDTLTSDTIAVQMPDCEALIPGCTDDLANNFNEQATIDDGSCEFPCLDVSLTITTDCWPEEVGWSIVDSNGETLFEVAEGTYEEEEVEEVWSGCVILGCHTLTITDGYGDGLNGSVWGSCEVDGNYVLSTSEEAVIISMGEPDFGSSIEHVFCLPVVVGCNEADACNYNPEANANDGSCVSINDVCDDEDDLTILDAIGEDCLCAGVDEVLGCTDESACNFSDLANSSDGSCTYVAQGTISGPVNPMTATTQVYSYNGPSEHSYVWSVTQGSFVGVSSGTGVTSVEVSWEGPAIGMDGVVSVTETDESGCEGSLSLDVDLLVNGVDELNAIGMSAYPNPVSETLWVDWDMKGEAVTLVIYNVLGEQVFNEFLQSNRTSIDCSDWAEGIYTAKVYDGLEQSLASFSLVVWR